MNIRSESSLFYDELAPLYHLKVDWKNRSAKEDRLFDYLITKLRPHSVLDLGCGDGGHAGRFSSTGIEYYGIDSSAKMIREAQKKNSSINRKHFLRGDMSNSIAKLKLRFDLVTILGNTLPHLLDSRSLNSALKNIALGLNDGGNLIIQTVNPGRFSGKEFFQLPPKMAKGVLFMPVYVKRRTHWDFIMMIADSKRTRGSNPKTIVTSLRFWSDSEVCAAASRHGLEPAATFGNSELTPYDKTSSDNLILVLKKVADARTSRG